MSRCSCEFKIFSSIDEALIYEAEQIANRQYHPLYYYILLQNDEEVIIKNLDDLFTYNFSSSSIKLVNGIVDEDNNGYTVYINLEYIH